MPTITFSLEDLGNLVGRKLSIEELDSLAEYGKGEVEKFEKDSGEITINFQDTSMPYLWSVEGFARLLKGILGISKGIPELQLKKSSYSLLVDESVKNIRPYVAAFIAKGGKGGCKSEGRSEGRSVGKSEGDSGGSRVNDYLLKQLVQLQEKLCESYGLRRKKVAIGIYPYDKISFPVRYKAVEPESVSFVPLEFKRKMTLGEMLKSHPKGKDYAWILDGMKKYPILVDSKNEVLSFPPIINSEFTGKILVGDEHLFVEATGTDLDAVLLVMNIMAYALNDRGFDIYSIDIKGENSKAGNNKSGNNPLSTPFLFEEKIKITPEQAKALLGLELKKGKIIELLEKMGYDVNSALTVNIPPYRRDILHPNDVIEDIAIAFGYNNIKEELLESYTIGANLPIVEFRNKIRDTIIGMGFQEVMSPILSNKGIFCDKMSAKGSGIVEIQNFMSETYSCLRSWLIPVLMEFLSKNKHAEYPQKIFEVGSVAVKKDGKISDFEKLSVLIAHDKADYTEIRQLLDCLLRMLGADYIIEEADHDSFIPGRVGGVIVKGRNIASLGEISPNVISRWGLEVPVVALEMDINGLFDFLQESNKM